MGKVVGEYRLLLAIVAWSAAFLVRSAAAGEAATEGSSQTSYALIWVGLPGDDSHRVLFATVVDRWQKWLTERLSFAPANVHIVPAAFVQKEAPDDISTRDAIGKQVAALQRVIGPQDRLWVFLLGHANTDGAHAWLHLAGADLRDDEVGRLFAGICCAEQVFWLATPLAARFLQRLSQKGRMIVAATGAEEDNEPEFAEAFCTVAERPVAELDQDQDGQVSVREFCLCIVADVQSRYAADRRLVTEHAQWDDNGDGRGTELSAETDANVEASAAEGNTAAKKYLPFR
jgi:hypothetical protein